MAEFSMNFLWDLLESVMVVSVVPQKPNSLYIAIYKQLDE